MVGLRIRSRARLGLALSAVLLCLGLAGEARAQAWVDEPGSATAGIDYTYGKSNRVIEDGEPFSILDEPVDAPIVSHSVLFAVEYAPIDRLGLSASLPLLGTRYDGTGEGFPPHGDYDDGSTHYTPTDFRFNARYQLLGPFRAITPHLGFTIPVADYETRGYAGAGRHLKKAHAGVSAGALLAPWVPRLFVHGRYEFSLAEKFDEVEELEKYGQNSSDLGLQIGYFVLDKLELHAAFDAHWQHGGFHFTDPIMAGDPVIEYHDAVLDEDYYLAGGGVSYSVIEDLRLTAFFRLYLTGQNTRDVNAFGLGLSYDVL